MKLPGPGGGLAPAAFQDRTARRVAGIDVEPIFTPGYLGFPLRAVRWGAHDAADMIALLESPPMYGWISAETSFAIHRDDPATTRLVMIR